MDNLVKTAINNCIDGLFDKRENVLSNGGLQELPNKETVLKIIELIRGVIFPRYFACGATEGRADVENALECVYELVCEEIKRAFCYECKKSGDDNKDCDIDSRAAEIALYFIENLPKVYDTLYYDIKATLAGDPAALSYDLIILTYPGIEAIFIYRLAHVLYEKNVPLIPRIMTEIAHSKTGIDIHPGAKIGKSFMIDHGTGTVIGETTEIGERVSVYQGVTLGAISLKDSRSLVGKKRHPTIRDNVTIYAGATILGGETVIGEGSVIGSSSFITESVDPFVTVTLEKPKHRLIKK